MKYAQRQPPLKRSFMATKQLWKPVVTDRDGVHFEVRASARDWYVVVDEVVGANVGLVKTSWPMVDTGGRLAFKDEGVPVDRRSTLDQLQRVVDRRDNRRVSRPLRIGDAFLVLG